MSGLVTVAMWFSRRGTGMFCNSMVMVWWHKSSECNRQVMATYSYTVPDRPTVMAI